MDHTTNLKCLLGHKNDPAKLSIEYISIKANQKNGEPFMSYQLATKICVLNMLIGAGWLAGTYIVKVSPWRFHFICLLELYFENLGLILLGHFFCSIYLHFNVCVIIYDPT